MEDTAIIRLFQERSQQAIAELSQKYGKLCQSLSRRILNNEEDAKECVNDTWLGVWNSIPPQTPNPLVSYVCRITRNLSVKRLRHNMAAQRNSYYDVSRAETFGMKENSVSVKLMRLRKKLRKKLEKEGVVL